MQATNFQQDLQDEVRQARERSEYVAGLEAALRQIANGGQFLEDHEVADRFREIARKALRA